MKKNKYIDDRIELLNNTLKSKNNNIYYKYKKTLKGYTLYKMCFNSWLDKEAYQNETDLLKEIKALINDYRKEV